MLSGFIGCPLSELNPATWIMAKVSGITTLCLKMYCTFPTALFASFFQNAPGHIRILAQLRHSLLPRRQIIGAHACRGDSLLKCELWTLIISADYCSTRDIVRVKIQASLGSCRYSMSAASAQISTIRGSYDAIMPAIFEWLVME